MALFIPTGPKRVLPTLTLSIEYEAKDAQRKLGDIGKKHVRAILPQALNAAARDVRKHTIADINATHKISKRLLGTRLRQGRKAKVRRPITSVDANFRAIPFHKLGKVTQTPEGVRVPIVGMIAGAFVAKMPTGHVGVFRRRLPSKRVGANARHRPRERGALPIVEYKYTFKRSATDALKIRGARRARVIFRVEFRARLLKRLKAKGII